MQNLKYRVKNENFKNLKQTIVILEIRSKNAYKVQYSKTQCALVIMHVGIFRTRKSLMQHCFIRNKFSYQKFKW